MTGWFSHGAVQAAAASFLPTDIADLEFWFDADDASTITETSGDVSQWDDKSGNGNNVVQATGAAQPTTSTINGNASLLFDGTDDRLRDSSATVGVDPISFAIVFTPTTVTGTGDDAFRLRDGSTNRVSFRRNDNDLNHFHDALTGPDINLALSNNLTANTTAWVICRMDDSGGADSDVLDDQDNSASVAGPTALQPSITDINIGGNADGGSAWAGHIHEVIVYNRFLTNTERTDLGNYLNAKWSL